MKIALVSGSPRSGTSAMMRLLGKSGVPLFFLEESRPADENNPLGYFENPLARQTIYISRNADEYINAIHGKLSKLAMSKFIINLPLDHTYYIIWMERDPMESAISLSKFKSFLHMFGSICELLFSLFCFDPFKSYILVMNYFT